MNSKSVTSLREKVHSIVDQFSEEELTSLWNLVSEFYHDTRMLKAIQDAKRSLTPGDSLTHEEALQFLSQS